MAKGVFHDAVKKGLVKQGWVITDDPLVIKVGGFEIKLIIYEPIKEVILEWKN